MKAVDIGAAVAAATKLGNLCVPDRGRQREKSNPTLLSHVPEYNFPRSRSAPPTARPSLYSSFVAQGAGRDRRVFTRIQYMLSSAPPPVDLTFADDEWIPQPRLYRGASVGNSWGVTSIGRGFDWDESPSADPQPRLYKDKLDSPLAFDLDLPPLRPHNVLTAEPFTLSPAHSRPVSPLLTPALKTPPTRSPTMPPRPRRRSSQARVSLIAGRVSIATIEPSSPVLPQALLRAGSASSLLSLATSTRAPSPVTLEHPQNYLGERNINEFVIEAEIGRGAYGLVKRAREKRPDAPPVIIKQIIKSRILADCWKKHPKHGTIPIEIYVMSSISQSTYVLPPRRPWDPNRPLENPEWIEGSVVNGHPNICPLLDFFEDNHYYYLVLPSTLPEQHTTGPAPPSDLFDLVEDFPHGLPPFSVRSYLGQLADALCFLHSRGIVHRDVKDENVILGPNGKCILIDFGSSGLVKRGGWDTFSGTLDYAGPEILRGERYEGKEQDCPFMTPDEAQDGLDSPFANASIALDERCGEGKEQEGAEEDGGGALEDAAAMVRACLQVSFQKILECRFLAGAKEGAWGA
ncbi:kinase-like protein [Roridomyces roridus]|uniref:Kinase-like protein n=1 Tax=Roridomyces roridus TaxID=1738132 RepID=A0AAD7BUM3_9AGAR|nr:kinase-like protein [Roridomyces roridus]